MLAAFVDVSGVVLRDVAEPEAGRGEIVVRMGVCGVCGTDLEKAHGRGITQAVLGHEVAGTVVETGEDVSDIEEGDRVYVHHHVSCGKCFYCLNGSPTMCHLFKTTNIYPGGFSELFKVSQPIVERGGVVNIGGMGFEEASFIEPLACCLRSLERAGFRPGMSAAVLGFGPAGALHAMALRASGSPYVVVADVSSYRLEYAYRVGVDEAVNLREQDLSTVSRRGTDGRGVDYVVVATGNPEALKTALDVVRPGGRICLFGAPPRSSTVEMELPKIFLNEISIIPNYSTTEKETREAFHLIKAGLVKPSILVSHRYRLADVVEAFKTASNPSASMKVVVHP
ncbi:Sorbitol dehydrogenase [archaeon HR01]|nr:Sorbitol dehydrogenase [archaeon HR01]